MSPTARLVLASASPRRRSLLSQGGLRFEVEPADVDERLESSDPVATARALAQRKARLVAARHGPGVFVLGADTIVAVPRAAGGFELLGKPEDEAHARRMLERLSGTRHAVVTAVCVVLAPDGACHLDEECTWVVMRPIEPAEVQDYVARGEWRDKAGGYAIQESADRFVLALEGGGFDNVVGLPVARTLGLLRRAGWS